MIFDWILREGGIILSWWLIATAAGAVALPYTFRLLGWLPDKGYALARVLGVLLTGFTFWILGSFGFLVNDAGSIVLSWLIVLGIGLVIFYTLRDTGADFDLLEWWSENRALVIATEILFIVLLFAWAMYRAHQNDLNGTEKPMDLAFLSAITRDPSLPPDDPWLSGYSISYYYFGYLLGSMFTTMSSVVTTIAYNMWTAMLFALSGIGAFGVVYNMVRALKRETHPNKPDRPYKAIIGGLLGVLMVVIIGNYEMLFIEFPREARIASESYLEFWDINTKQDTLPPLPDDVSFNPTSIGSDWFRSARSMNDRNLPEMVEAGYSERVEVINEFPMFSFVLADNHPHVMSLPFSILMVLIALNVLLSPYTPNRYELAFYGVIAGSLIFLNTWDLPVQLVIITGAEGLRRLMRRGFISVDDLFSLGRIFIAMLIIGVIAYLPFLISFRSQLSGVLPNLIYPTLFQQYFLTFGPLVPLTVIFLIYQSVRGQRSGRMNWRMGLTFALIVGLVLLLMMVVLVLLGALIPSLQTGVQNFVNSAGGWGSLIGSVLAKRLTHIVTSLVLLAGLAVVVARLYPRATDDELQLDLVSNTDKRSSFISYRPSTGFALLLIGAGIGLTLIPEFIFLRDNFSTRMNTVFKFYYQAWMLIALGSAYAIYVMLFDVRGAIESVPARLAVSFAVIAIVAGGLVYPLFAINYRANVQGTRVGIDDEASITLDGWRGVVRFNDYVALNCLADIVGRDPVVIAEATGGSYDFMQSGRTGALTGMPTVLGWQGHQAQWRGTGYAEAVGSRPSDIPRLYEDLRLDVVQDIINRYGIDYILYGGVERERYGAGGEQKFAEAFDVVCESGDTRIYRTRNVPVVRN